MIDDFQPRKLHAQYFSSAHIFDEASEIEVLVRQSNGICFLENVSRL